MAFKLGEDVVYPLHGVGIIQENVERKVKDELKAFYKVSMKDTGLSISIPIDKAEDMGLRRVIKKKDIPEILKDLTQYPKYIEENWKLRFQENIEKLKKGDIENIVTVVKELFIRNKIKNLSIMERKQYEQAFKMLVKEISISSKTDEDEVNNLISGKLDDLGDVHEKKAGKS